MENSLPTIQIESTVDHLTPGATVRLPVLLVLNKALKVRGVHATFHGAEETKATYTTYNAATKTNQTHTAVEHIDIVKSEFLLFGSERKGFFGNLTDGFATLLGGGKHEVLQPGEHPFEVEVRIPQDARPSFAGEKCRIFYELSVLADIPLGRDLKALQSFRLPDVSNPDLPPPEPVRTRYPDDQAPGLFESWLSPDLQVEVALRQSTFRQGDTIEGIFQVETPKPLNYNAVNVRLITAEKTEAHGHSDSFTHSGKAVQIATQGVIDGSYSQRFQIEASCPGPWKTQGRLFSIDCFLQIELDVPWAKDPKIRVPISLVPS